MPNVDDASQAPIRSTCQDLVIWSRPSESKLNGKPVAIIGASTGNFGTVRAQLHLRQVLTHVGALPLGKPEVLMARAEQAFDAEGGLVDAAARGFLRDLLAALGRWIERVGPTGSLRSTQ